MDSSTGRIEEEIRRKLELEKQIATLQAQLAEIPDAVPSARAVISSVSPKQKRPEPTILAPPTPSPKKRRKVNHEKHSLSRPTPHSGFAAAVKEKQRKPEPAHVPTKVAPSNLLNKLSAINRPVESQQTEITQRTTGFTETPMLPASSTPQHDANKRDENLALVEELEPGPYEHTPPSNDPNFEQLEPNSGIRLSSRIVSHDDLQHHLYARYYLSPSRLYSCIRLLPDKQGYDVPVPGDWITIAVVAERGPVRFTRAPVTVVGDDDSNSKWKKGKQKEKDEAPRQTGKKFVNMKLIDFGARAKSSATGSQAVIRGDAFLTLLLFESDGFDLTTRGGDEKAHKLYKGGSRGAFESMAKVKEGDVIALLNPKILKPFQQSNDSPHPVHNILAVTPESAASILVIGKSKDLGMCTVKKKDGKVCGSWCDKRVGDVCEYHVQSAVQRQRSGRAEFSAGTSGMSTTSTAKRKYDYDPAKQWGLKPEENMTSRDSTYVISGHVVSGTNTDPRTIYVTENIGREGQAKAKRKLNGRDADRSLQVLLERDKEGMKTVMKAREFKKVDDELPNGTKQKGSLKSKAEKEDLNPAPPSNRAKSAYTAQIIKSLGFDPTVKAGQTRSNELHIQDKLEALEGIRKSKTEIALGPRPGLKIRSGVFAPTSATKENTASRKSLPAAHNNSSTEMIDLDDF